MFITFEGIDGSGKTTQISKLESFFNAQKRDVLVTSEPAKCGKMGEAVYNVIKEYEDSTLLTDLLLVYVLRSLHVAKVIKPALNSGKTVICGRYVDSSVVYYAGSLEKYDAALKQVLFLQDMAAEGLAPDMTFLLDISAELCAERIAARGQPDRFDRIGAEQMNRTRQLFLHNANNGLGKGRTHVLDGSKSEDQIFADIIKIIDSKPN